MSFAAIGIGLGAAGAIGKIGTGLAQNKKANAINPVWDDSSVNNQLGTALNLFNGRMAGAGNLENNIRAAQGNTINNINKNATDASQALALAQGSQNTADNAYNDLQTKEAQNKYSLLDNLNAAYGAVNNNMKAKFGIESQAKAATREGAFKDIFGGIGDLSSLGIAGGSSGLLDGLFKGRGAGSFIPQSTANSPLNINNMGVVNRKLPPIMGFGNFGVGQ